MQALHFQIQEHGCLAAPSHMQDLLPILEVAKDLGNLPLIHVATAFRSAFSSAGLTQIATAQDMDLKMREARLVWIQKTQLHANLPRSHRRPACFCFALSAERGLAAYHDCPQVVRGIPLLKVETSSSKPWVHEYQDGSASKHGRTPRAMRSRIPSDATEEDRSPRRVSIPWGQTLRWGATIMCRA